MPRLITSFSDNYDFLSNFARCDIRYEGMTFPSTEAAFQAAKTLDLSQRVAFTQMGPGKAKRAGRALPLRPDWEEVKDQVMLDLLRIKFQKPGRFANLLEDTGHEILVEGTTWHDQYWGVCKCPQHLGVGVNMLGQLLMQVRAENRGHTPFMLHHEKRRDWLSGGPFTIEERQ